MFVISVPSRLSIVFSSQRNATVCQYNYSSWWYGIFGAYFEQFNDRDPGCKQKQRSGWDGLFNISLCSNLVVSVWSEVAAGVASSWQSLLVLRTDNWLDLFAKGWSSVVSAFCWRDGRWCRRHQLLMLQMSQKWRKTSLVRGAMLGSEPCHPVVETWKCQFPLKYQKSATSPFMSRWSIIQCTIF